MENYARIDFYSSEKSYFRHHLSNVRITSELDEHHCLSLTKPSSESTQSVHASSFIPLHKNELQKLSLSKEILLISEFVSNCSHSSKQTTLPQTLCIRSFNRTKKRTQLYKLKTVPLAIFMENEKKMQKKVARRKKSKRRKKNSNS